MKITLFGGSFDPPHSGHQQVAQTILENGLCDQLWYVPCFRHPFDKNITDSKHRLAMLELIQTPNILVEKYETEQDKVSYSIDTLRYFQNKFPEHEFSWIIGSDQVDTFHLWKEYEELIKRWTVHVYPRGTDAVSSTQIRKRMKEGEPITGLVHPLVEGYIIEHNLYK